MANPDYPLHRPELGSLLSQGEAKLLQAMDAPRTYREGEALVRAGEESRMVYRLESGWATRSREMPDGRRQINAVYLPGDVICIKSMLLERQTETIECLTEIRARAIDFRQLLELIGRDQAVNLRVMFQLAEDERRLHNWLAALGCGSAEERIATLLLDLRGRLYRAGLAKQGSFSLPMTQQEIGNHLGLTVVHVNRVLKRMRDSGVVTVRRGDVTVSGMPELARLAAPLQDVFERSTPEFGGQAEAS